MEKRRFESFHEVLSCLKKKSTLGFCRLLKNRSLKKWEKHRAKTLSTRQEVNVVEQSEIANQSDCLNQQDHLFKTLGLPILTYGLVVYGASDSDLNVIERFLDRCHKRHFTSQTVSIFNLLEQQDKSAFKRAINNHMLGAIIPKEKELVYNLRKRRCHLPQIQENFLNRLIFKYNLVQYYSILYYYCILSCFF